MTDKNPTTDFTNNLLTTLMERTYKAGFNAAKEIYQDRIRGLLNISTSPDPSQMKHSLELIVKR